MFSFGAPYYLGPTDISKLTAFYDLYDPSDNFVLMAARLLFQEIQATGNSPVSIPGLGYDLINITSPDPNQTISLRLLKNNPNVSGKNTPEPLPSSLPGVLPVNTVTPIPTVQPIFKVGDTVYVQSGMILDHNQHIVPDGTPVRFSLAASDDYMQQVEAFTVGGVATATVRLDRAGFLQISVTSEPVS